MVRALWAVPRTGRAALLGARHLRRVEPALLRGARAHGVGSDVWTLPNVATVIERTTGERFHSGQVWRILRGMGGSLQRPARRARERKEAVLAAWIPER